jgi:hypothetical protein
MIKFIFEYLDKFQTHHLKNKFVYTLFQYMCGKIWDVSKHKKVQIVNH